MVLGYMRLVSDAMGIDRDRRIREVASGGPLCPQLMRHSTTLYLAPGVEQFAFLTFWDTVLPKRSTPSLHRNKDPKNIL